jgi:CheY-like chemotaxis protein
MAFDLSMPILVVDDYNTMIRIIRNLLKQIGFENVDDASDGSAALTKMQGRKYGLVISDWNMEPMTGYDLLREVRASAELSQTPFYHDHGGIEDRERDRRKEGRCEQLHRQAIQCRHAEDQNGSGLPGLEPNESSSDLF